jgi:hypothetical protein
MHTRFIRCWTRKETSYDVQTWFINWNERDIIQEEMTAVVACFNVLLSHFRGETEKNNLWSIWVTISSVLVGIRSRYLQDSSQERNCWGYLGPFRQKLKKYGLTDYEYCLKHLWWYVITLVGNLWGNKKSRVFNEISGMAISVPITCLK